MHWLNSANGWKNMFLKYINQGNRIKMSIT